MKNIVFVHVGVSYFGVVKEKAHHPFDKLGIDARVWLAFGLLLPEDGASRIIEHTVFVHSVF